VIEFVFSREQKAKTNYVIEKMKSALALGKKVILIIPEHQALQWDTVCAKSFPKRDALRMETLSFTRLADSVFRRFGGSAKRYVTKAEKALLMWSAVNSVKHELSTLKDPDSRYIDLINHAVSELKLYGVSPEELALCAERVEGEKGTLSFKMKDLALIYAAYNALLHASFDDPEETLDALSKCLCENTYFENTEVFIDSFYTLTPKELRVVREIFKGADTTLITFAYSREDRELPHIQHIHDYMKRLFRVAASCGLEVRETDIDGERREEFSKIKRDLWNFSAESFFEETDALTFIDCADRHDEAILAGARIKELVSGGARFGDIACVAANFDNLRGITDIELEKQGIPVYVSGRTPVSSQGALRLLFSALSVIGYGWRREDLVLCARTGLCSLTPDEADAFEAYTEKWQLRGRKMFMSDVQWHMNPDGYTEEMTSWGERMLTLANGAKKKLISPIEALEEAFPCTMKEAAEAAFRLLCDFDVYGSLVSETAALETAGDLSKAQEKSQVWNAVLQVLDCAALTVPGEVVDAKRFAALLRKIAETLSIGTIPDGIDRVALGSVEGVRLDNVKHLLILGARSGEFPRVPKDDGYFNDSDRRIMRKAGIELSPDTISQRNEELFRFCEAAGSPEETLTVFIPRSGELSSPSLGAVRLMKLFPRARYYDFTCPEAEKIIRTYGNSLADFSEGSLSAVAEKVDGEVLEKLFDKDITLSQSKIECFNSCAFKYYCEHVLGLDDGSRAEVKPSNVGTFVHWVLENFMKEARDEGFPLSEESIREKEDRLIREYRKKIAPEGESGYIDYIFDRIGKSIDLFLHSLNEEFAQSSFIPHSFELRVGFSSDLPVAPIHLENGHDLRVRGIVDRLDVYRENGTVYIRVADYKTGAKTFSLTDVMRGKNIQLLLYLFSLCNMPKDCAFYSSLAPNGEKISPAGAVYFSARPGDIQSDNMLVDENAEKYALDSISRSGIVLGDRDIIRAMDREISGKYAPVSIGAKDKLKGSFAEDERAFFQIEDTLNEFLKRVGDTMASGKADAVPEGYGDNSACAKCSMMPLCRSGAEARNKAARKGERDE